MKIRYYTGFGIALVLFAVLVFGRLDDNIVQISPANKSAITSLNPVFDWSGNANTILVDDNEQFTSPISEKIQSRPYKLESNLSFGSHYWKLIGEKESAVFEFKVDSIVALKVAAKNESLLVDNIGNSPIEVEIQQKKRGLWSIMGFAVLERNESREFEGANDTLFVARQK